LTVVRQETRPVMCQKVFTLYPAVKGLEALFATLIMAEKRQVSCQTTLFPFVFLSSSSTLLLFRQDIWQKRQQMRQNGRIFGKSQVYLLVRWKERRIDAQIEERRS